MTAGPVLMRGPTKRSADDNDYVALEADLARAREEVESLRSRLAAATATTAATEDTRVRDLARRYAEAKAESARRMAAARAGTDATQSTVDACVSALSLRDAYVDAVRAERLAATALADAVVARTSAATTISNGKDGGR